MKKNKNNRKQNNKFNLKKGDYIDNGCKILSTITPGRVEINGKPASAIICLVETPDGYVKLICCIKKKEKLIIGDFVIKDRSSEDNTEIYSALDNNIDSFYIQ